MTKTKDDFDFGMTCDQIFRALSTSLDVSPENAVLHMSFAQIQMMAIHARVLACHAESLGMNAENMWSAIANNKPVFGQKHYQELMQKWRLIDEKGNSIL